MSLTITGVLIIILSQFIELATAQELAADISLIIGVIAAWYGRYRLGDLDLLGKRK